MWKCWAAGATGILGLFLLCGALCGAAPAAGENPPVDDPPPDWAYVIYQKAADPGPKAGRVTVPGSRINLAPDQLDDPFGARDWFPNDHPAMPEAVAHGHAQAPKLASCSRCHLATGAGEPDNAALSALPADYIVAQVNEFRAGRRGCAVPRAAACRNVMMKMALAASDAEVRASADYFSRLRYRSRIKVVEAAMAPKTAVMGFFLARATGGGEEALGQRILELPDDLAAFDAGDWRSPITAYAPPGSVARGRALVRSGAGAAPCGGCHGARLQGKLFAPPLAGRSPSYLVRQLYDMQYGFRGGPAAAPMAQELAHLGAQDRIAIAAYLASLRP